MKNHTLIASLIFGLIFIFFFSFFAPGLIFAKTSTTGGDTISHFPTAVYLKNVLLPTGNIMGWDQGNYAGYPLFYHYFPLTFIVMAVLSFIMPIEIAFKIGTILGTFLLPVCTYFALRAMKYSFPIPLLSACFTLPFLFMEANSMWGGNIPSTLAGESSYSFSFALMILFFGTLYAGIKDQKWVVSNSLLLFGIGLSHGFTFVFIGVIALFFLFTKKDFVRNLIYLFKAFSLAVLLLGFWFIPFLGNIPYVISYVSKWYVDSIFKIIPPILMPFWGLSFVALFLNLFDRRTAYFIHVVVASFILYWLAPNIGMLDIRFVPFIQFYLTIFGATVILVFLTKIKNKELLPFIVFLAVTLWVLPHVTYIKGWIKWNYEGLETKSSWPLLQKIHYHLSETKVGRVVYEHSPKHNIFGSERIFENLSNYAGRNTLEGLYMQSSISAPFVFYIQSEVSKLHSGPFPQYKYSYLNLPAALPHLKLFNVTQYIVRSPEAKQAIKKIPQLKLEWSLDDYEIYRLTNNDGHYVVLLKNEPVLFQTNDWKQDFYAWFTNLDDLEIPLVYIKHPTAQDLKKFPLRSHDLAALPRVALPDQQPEITEKLLPQEIDFTTNLIGRPHLIKVSYHPNWQVVGADKIYLVSPSFMLVYPKQAHVRLYFGKTIYNYIGEVMSILGLLILFSSVIIKRKDAR
ncbi:hypothetical protein COT42_08950 [Candidatus Saganbacteria bacterium CG08_land_8_20_14_0_20_45_16]|uniref:Membrane protein 6-pyruvoyl-tetrahydropterin synthase-related domain-containing protein n=1 Tax=Candidatus Saganbacteria bacterium CG08_land_8_20_14_0_20_45_16 TaxID=2014293 RepID=A0A2H0XVF2_UNCSA|nr:MAG: hypothetical protein COT42_08950 [Candidatus Saganbacteria bacterium CG08_land_8_20_14_0_20_45_16]